MAYSNWAAACVTRMYTKAGTECVQPGWKKSVALAGGAVSFQRSAFSSQRSAFGLSGFVLNNDRLEACHAEWLHTPTVGSTKRTGGLQGPPVARASGCSVGDDRQSLPADH